MTTIKSLISVIIPVYNCERYVAEAIKSALAQTYRPIEIIVINDGSTDDTEQAVRQFGDLIRYYAQPNRGLGASRNRGAQLADGDFLAFLDSDDLWVMDKLELQMTRFEMDPALDMVFGHVRQFYTEELEAELKTKIRYIEEVMRGYIAGTLLIKRESFFKVGLFEPTLRVGEFLDWFMKAEEQKLKSEMIQEIVMERRLHGSNTGIRQRQHQTDFARVLKAALDRRRAAGDEPDKEQHAKNS